MFISYKQIIKQAWQIAIRNKFLWVFGIFASFVSLENVYEIILSQIGQAQDPLGFYQSIFNFRGKQTLIATNALQSLDLLKFDLTGLLAFIVVGGIIILLIWLALTSQIFVIKSTNLIYRGKKVIANLTFNQSDEHFLPVLGLHLLAKLVLYAGFIAMSLPVLYFILTNNLTWLVYVNIVFFILYIIFSVIISFLAAYATNFIVLKNLSVVEAISAAWKLFKKNVLISIEMATILFFLKLVSIILILSLFLLFVMPLSVFLLFSAANGDFLAIVLIITILILIFTLLSLFINSLFATFYLACWTVTFTKLTEDTLYGKILNWITNLPGYVRQFTQKHKITIDEKKVKTQAIAIAKEANLQARELSRELSEKYTEYKPAIQKQSKKLKRQAKAAYIKYQPIVKKESIKMAKEINSAYQKFEPILEKKANKILLDAKKNWQKSSNPKRKSTKSSTKIGKKS